MGSEVGRLIVGTDEPVGTDGPVELAGVFPPAMLTDILSAGELGELVAEVRLMALVGSEFAGQFVTSGPQLLMITELVMSTVDVGGGGGKVDPGGGGKVGAGGKVG